VFRVFEPKATFTEGTASSDGNVLSLSLTFIRPGTFDFYAIIGDVLNPDVEGSIAVTVNPHPSTGVFADMTVAVESDPSTFSVDTEYYTFIFTHYPANIDIEGLFGFPTGEERRFPGISWFWPGETNAIVRFIDWEYNDNVLKQRLEFVRPGTFDLYTWIEHNRNTTEHQMRITVSPGSGGTTPPVYTPSYTAPLRTGFNSSPAPGSPAFSMHAGMGAANRTVANIRRTVSNDTTAEEILSAIQDVLPDGVTARWGTNNSQFRLVPATVDTPGRITGLIIITSGTGSNQTSTAINLNIIIPALAE
jgi:hypothetical protein